MREPRRKFLWCAGAMLSGTVLELGMAGQTTPKRQFPTPPQGVDQLPTAQADTTHAVTSGTIVREHEKAFRECLSVLSLRVSHLNQEVDARQPADFFSVNVYKQTGEIEKLAKQLKNLARG